VTQGKNLLASDGFQKSTLAQRLDAWHPLVYWLHHPPHAAAAVADPLSAQKQGKSSRNTPSFARNHTEGRQARNLIKYGFQMLYGLL
jgi:hypothetical protein